MESIDNLNIKNMRGDYVLRDDEFVILTSSQEEPLINNSSFFLGGETINPAELLADKDVMILFSGRFSDIPELELYFNSPAQKKSFLEILKEIKKLEVTLNRSCLSCIASFFFFLAFSYCYETGALRKIQPPGTTPC